ncbi:hypothetical protein EV421DRAFT_1911519 [Armillaria borealis]|uniref:F-box domain-containing protein n=1 Tax=Armillaria borealis TaxID=47425 RepID=A0AA39MFP4_9AGAR|nr:hypothetical protein EV421DRAFT_1911519 [Armillaria borealis]
MLFSVPEELLERILYECCNRDRESLRSTCMLLYRLATPLVFEKLVVNGNTSRDKSMARLRALISGKRFAQYVRHLKLVMLKLPEGKPKDPFDWIFFFNKRKERKSRKLEKLLLAAISFMISLRSVTYLGYDERFLQNFTLWDQISHLPYMSTLSIYGSYRQSTSMNLSFPYLAKLSIQGTSYLKFAPILISNSPNLSSLGIYDYSPSTSSLSMSIIFSQYPKGTYSSITDLSLCGSLSVYSSDVPILIPHIYQLRSLELNVGFVASEFWASLQAERIFVRRLSLSLSKYDPALFDYLCSYSGLHSLFLHIRTGFREQATKGPQLTIMGWHDHMTAPEPHKQRKQTVDVADVRRTLKIVLRSLTGIERSWAPVALSFFREEFQHLTMDRVKLFCSAFPDCRDDWYQLGFEVV